MVDGVVKEEGAARPVLLGPRLAGVLLLLVILLALLVRLPGLTTLSITLEEYACIYHLDAPDFGSFITLQRGHYPYGAPLVPMLQYAWAHTVDSGIGTLRALSLMATLLIIPLLYAFTQRLFHDPGRARAAGLIAALCAALSHVHVYHGQEARMYAFLALFALASAYATTRVLQGGSRRWWMLSLVANALLVWTHLFGVLLVAVEGLALLIAFHGRWRSLLAWGLAHLMPLAPLAVWILTIPPQPANLTGYYGAPQADQIFWDLFGDDVVFRASLGFAAPPLRDPTLPWWARSYPAVEWGMALLFIAATLWLVGRLLRARTGARAPWGFLLLWLLLPICVLVAISYAWTPVYSSRYTIYSVYPLYIALGGLLTLIPRRAVVGALGIGLTALYAQQLVFAHTRPVRTQWKEVIAQIGAEASKHDVILLEDFFWLRLFEMNNDRVDLPTAAALSRETLRELAGDTTNNEDARRAWVVLVDIGGHPPGSFDAALRETGLGCASWRYPGERPLELVRVDGRPAETPAPVAPWPVNGLARALDGQRDNPHVAALQEAVYFHPDTAYGPWLRLGLEAGVHANTALATRLLAEAAGGNPQYAVYLALLDEALTGTAPPTALPFVAAAHALDRNDPQDAHAALEGVEDTPIKRWMRWRIYLWAGDGQRADALRAEIEADALPGAWMSPYETVAGL